VFRVTEGPLCPVKALKLHPQLPLRCAEFAADPCIQFRPCILQFVIFLIVRVVVVPSSGVAAP
jgi:hypothetical protein